MLKKPVLINEKKTISDIMDEIKNMLDYKVGHYITVQQENILRSFKFIKQKFFPNGDMDKSKARLVADGSQ